MVNRVGPCRKIISLCKAQAGCGFVVSAEVVCTCLQGNDRLLGVNKGAGCKEIELNLPPQKIWWQSHGAGWKEIASSLLPQKSRIFREVEYFESWTQASIELCPTMGCSGRQKAPLVPRSTFCCH